MSSPVTLYTYAPSLGVIRTVYRLDDTPTTINYSDMGGFAPPQPPVDTTISIICAPGTFDEYTYKVKTNPPYAYYTKVSNSSHCGYTPPTCDISISSFFKTDETDAGANDGTANLFCVSTYAPITYYLIHVILPSEVIVATNTTGYFTNIPPGNYRILAEDTNSCQINKPFTIIAFSSDYTHYKYRLQFPNKDNSMIWELQLYDMRNAYLKTDYPKDVEGNEDPVVWTRQDQEEDKISPIITHQLDIGLLYDGTLFTIEEFATAPEQTWYVQLVSDDTIYFKGYLIPDEMQDEYSDPPYIVMFKATDGLPSLKGNLWGDGTGGQGYGTLQIQQYGFTLWANLVKQCLDQLGYNYGGVHIVSSLQYNNLFTTSLWLNISTWSDILYDSSGVPISTYDALSLLLMAMKLTIFQEKGEFRLINWNDLSYINNGVVARQFSECFYQILPGFTGIITEDVNIQYEVIGFDVPLSPANPPQTWNFDKPYNIENDVSFNILSLLYENPSFEIGAVQGELPPDWINHIDQCPAYCNYDPLTEDIGSGALDGNWELKIEGYDGTQFNYIETSPFFNIDQANKLLNVSFGWKPSDTTGVTIDGHEVGMVFCFAIVFVDGSSGNEYYLFNVPNVNISLDDYNGGHTASFQNAVPFWSTTNPPFYNSEGELSSIKGTPTKDFIGWQSFSITCPPFPESQRGNLYIRFYPSVYQMYDNTNWPVLPNARVGIYQVTGPDHSRYVLIDQLNITLSDASGQYNKQTGEKHITTVVTGLPPADIKQNDLKLFTYPNNKRVAGNIFYGTEYLSAIVANTWNFALKGDKLDRIPAIITKAYARQYQKCYYKFDGEVEAPYMSYYAVYGLRFYEGKLFMAYKIESHLRDNLHSITLIEISDDEAQNIYTYTPLFERSARNQ